MVYQNCTEIPTKKIKVGENTLVPNVYIFVPAVSIFHTKLYLLHRDDAFVIKYKLLLLVG